MNAHLKYPLNYELLRTRLQEVEKSLQRLKALKSEFTSKEKFINNEDAYGICEHHLRRSLEALLTCGSHILSRIPGAKFDAYSTIASQLADYGIIPPKFRETAVKMAKYRNRLVHFYHQVSKEELHEILKTHLSDLEDFYLHLLRFTKSQSKV